MNFIKRDNIYARKLLMLLQCIYIIVYCTQFRRILQPINNISVEYLESDNVAIFARLQSYNFYEYSVFYFHKAYTHCGSFILG